MNKVKLVSITPDAEETIAYIARVSNPQNQDNEKYEGLLKYMRICGLISSFKLTAGNLVGLQYINKNGFNTSKFVSHLNHEQIHLYNFGRLDQTLQSL